MYAKCANSSEVLAAQAEFMEAAKPKEKVSQTYEDVYADLPGSSDDDDYDE